MLQESEQPNMLIVAISSSSVLLKITQHVKSNNGKTKYFFYPNVKDAYSSIAITTLAKLDKSLVARQAVTIKANKVSTPVQL